MYMYTTPWLAGIYLLKKAHGKAGAGLSNQHVFMHLMGLTDDHRPTKADGSDWPCPVSVEELDLLTAASNHQFFR